VALEDRPANRRKYMRHDYIFHSGVLEIAGSPPLTATLGSLNIMVSAFSGSGVIRPMRESMAEHAMILEAFQHRDPDRAEAAMRKHLSRTVELLYHEADLIERNGGV
jgi:DNA-binding GntR family transcriptional regulator